MKDIEKTKNLIDDLNSHPTNFTLNSNHNNSIKRNRQYTNRNLIYSMLYDFQTFD